ncbi:BLIP family protein [Streptomyces sp. NBC_00178]|uniref:BLIP family protein n=1 Tax=Streptomyces sp. NBC_00178 TaxID=2975672 RepID=UPI002E2C904A|nr:BLIP family protein [Streptomyces sp. NBC_00178]
MKARIARAGVALAAAAAALVATTSAAEANSGFSVEKYEQIQFGMTFDEVWQIGGGEPACDTGGVVGDSILCFTESSDYAPYGGFDFTDDGKLYSKRNEFLYKPKTPSIRLSHYNKTALGMSEAQVWAVVPKDSCVVQGQRYPNWPATTGFVEKYACKAATGLFPPTAYFDFTDGKLTYRNQRSLT